MPSQNLNISIEEDSSPFFGNWFQCLIVFTVKHIVYIQVEFLLNPVVPIAFCLLTAHPCEESTFFFITTIKYSKIMIRFPLTSSSQGLTNPVPSAFIHIKFSNCLVMLQLVSDFLAAPSLVLALIGRVESGTKHSHAKNDLSPALYSPRQLCNSGVRTPWAVELAVSPALSFWGCQPDTAQLCWARRAHTESLPWKAGLTDLFRMLRPYGSDYLWR